MCEKVGWIMISRLEERRAISRIASANMRYPERYLGMCM